MKKKIWLFILCVVMLCGCGKEEAQPHENSFISGIVESFIPEDMGNISESDIETWLENVETRLESMLGEVEQSETHQEEEFLYSEVPVYILTSKIFNPQQVRTQ